VLLQGAAQAWHGVESAFVFDFITATRLAAGDFAIGKLSLLPGQPAKINLDAFLTRHAAILGQTGGGPVMGYSIRDARWRGTFWRERGGSKIIARELHGRQNGPTETVNLARQPAHQFVTQSLRKYPSPRITPPPRYLAAAGMTAWGPTSVGSNLGRSNDD